MNIKSSIKANKKVRSFSFGNDDYYIKCQMINKFTFKYKVYEYVASGFDKKTGAVQFNDLMYGEIHGKGNVLVNGKKIMLATFHDDSVGYTLDGFPRMISDLCKLFKKVQNSKFYKKNFLKPYNLKYGIEKEHMPF